MTPNNKVGQKDMDYLAVKIFIESPFTKEVIGKVRISQMLDTNIEWIGILTAVQEDGLWVEREWAVNKEDIYRIVFFEQNSFLSFRDGRATLKNTSFTKAWTTV